MDAVCCSPSLKGSSVPEKDDPCPICFVDFGGRDVVPVIVKTQCGHRYDLWCIAGSFITQPVGSRQCAMCRQDPMPLVNEDTGEAYSDEFFLDQAFFVACSGGELELVRLRLAQGGNVNGTTARHWTGLMRAAENGQLEVARLLIEKGAEVDVTMADGWTALMLAAEGGQLEVARLLIEKGAKVEVT